MNELEQMVKLFKEGFTADYFLLTFPYKKITKNKFRDHSWICICENIIPYKEPCLDCGLYSTGEYLNLHKDMLP